MASPVTGCLPLSTHSTPLNSTSAKILALSVRSVVVSSPVNSLVFISSGMLQIVAGVTILQPLKVTITFSTGGGLTNGSFCIAVPDPVPSLHLKCTSVLPPLSASNKGSVGSDSCVTVNSSVPTSSCKPAPFSLASQQSAAIVPSHAFGSNLNTADALGTEAAPSASSASAASANNFSLLMRSTSPIFAISMAL